MIRSIKELRGSKLGASDGEIGQVKDFYAYDKHWAVGEKKWQEGMATFCKPFTKATVKYFDLADAAEARKWSSHELQ